MNKKSLIYGLVEMKNTGTVPIFVSAKRGLPFVKQEKTLTYAPTLGRPEQHQPRPRWSLTPQGDNQIIHDFHWILVFLAPYKKTPRLFGLGVDRADGKTGTHPKAGGWQWPATITAID
jgi:hypothetical protein